MKLNAETLFSFAYDASTGSLETGTATERRLSQLAGCFADEAATLRALEGGDPLVYTVSSVDPGSGPGDLHCGLGVLYPGMVGNEYFLTKGHYHERREAAEFYIGLDGSGLMLLEDEESGLSRLEALSAGRMVYVPGYTAHRTINTGSEPLRYFGVYPADAGHDYGAIAERNFLKKVVEEAGVPVLLDR